MSATYDFATVQDRLAWSATKWEKYRGQDIIPLWIADMDFPVAPPIQAAVAAHVAHGNYGYMSPPGALPAQLVEYYQQHYGWQIEPEWIVWLSGLVLGINLAVKACCAPGERAISLSPIYPPFLNAPGLQGRQLVDVPLKALNEAATEFAIDFDALEQCVSVGGPISDHAEHGDGMETPATRVLLLCHPHNPIGRLFSREELDRLAAFCDRHDLYVCSDEVHSDLILDGQTRHLPFAVAMAERSPALLKRTITLSGPGKTYNIAGLGVAWAIIPDEQLRHRFRAAMEKLVPDACCFGFTALQAALTQSEPWRQALLAQLRSNRDQTCAALERMGLPHTTPQVSYLIWIDARRIARQVDNLTSWFEQHGIGLSDGADFGRPGYLRLNFAAPPTLLCEGLARMERAVASLAAPPA